jgi:hypothetical protein
VDSLKIQDDAESKEAALHRSSVSLEIRGDASNLSKHADTA